MASSRPKDQRPHHRIRWHRSTSIALLAAVLLATGACGSHDKPAAKKPAGLSGAPSGVPTVAAGSPKVCTDLVSNAAILGLHQALRDAIAGASGGTADLRSAADGFRSYGKEGLGPQAAAVADALDRMAANPQDLAAVKSFAAATKALDQEVSTTCRTS